MWRIESKESTPKLKWTRVKDKEKPAGEYFLWYSREPLDEN